MLKESGGETLRQEVTALKELDLQALAARAITSKLIKQGLLPKRNMTRDTDLEQLDSQYPLHAAARKEGLYTELHICPGATISETIVERVGHQLLSSKILAEDMAASINALNELVRPEDASANKGRKAARAKEQDNVNAADPAPRRTNADVKPAPSEPNIAADDDFDDDVSDTGPRNWDAMVASGSDTEDEGTARNTDDDFLPSLATGFIPAREGDDWSDGDAEFPDSGTKGPPKSMRKNRRGQRERRAYVILC